MDETDRRFIGVLLFLGSITLIATVQTRWGTVSGIILWIVSLLWMAQPRPHTEHSYEAYRKNNTPLEEAHHGNLVGRRR